MKPLIIPRQRDRSFLTTDEEDKVTLFGCGLKVINGTYKKCGEKFGAPMYSKRGIWNGEEEDIVVYREFDTCWYICIMDKSK